MEKLLNYNDIVLIPNYSTVRSRSTVDTSVEFLGHKFKSCVIPANMACTISFELAEQLSKAGYFYILHRFYDYSKIKEWIEKNQNDMIISISLGVKEKDFNFITSIQGLKVDFITVDIAMGHSNNLKDMVEWIKDFMPNTKVIGGNIFGHEQSIKDLENWGCDALKIGLSYGKSCSTYKATGFGSPMATAALNAGKYAIIPVILDGGIRNNGDMAKALVLAEKNNIFNKSVMLMAGSIFAKCADSPAEMINGKKMYYGSASKENGNSKHIEGFLNELECNGMSYMQKFEQIKQDLSSACSYAGSSNLKGLKNVEYCIVENNYKI